MPSQRALPTDARTFALLLIDHFGERAVSYALHQSLKATSRGDRSNATRWRWMAEVTQFVLHSDDTADAGKPEVPAER